VLFDKILPHILFEKYINILALVMTSPGNQHCAYCIGTLSFPIGTRMLLRFLCNYRASSCILSHCVLVPGLAVQQFVASVYVAILTNSVACWLAVGIVIADPCSGFST